MVDYKKRIINLEAGWPGSVGDARVWSCSALNESLETWLLQLPKASLLTGEDPEGKELLNDILTFILADSVYPNTKNEESTVDGVSGVSSPDIVHDRESHMQHYCEMQGMGAIKITKRWSLKCQI